MDDFQFTEAIIAGWLHAGGDQGQGGQELRHRGLQLHEEAVRQPPFCFFV
jgi:hypothetical protein